MKRKFSKTCVSFFGGNVVMFWLSSYFWDSFFLHFHTNIFFLAKNHQKATHKWALRHAYLKMWALNLEILPKAMTTKWQHNLATFKP